MTGIAQQWLAKAREDLATVEKHLDDVGLTNIAAFHAQHCIEKCFKESGDALK
jgi:HEPN domain-containing protein